MVDSELKSYLDTLFPGQQVDWLNRPHDAVGGRTLSRALKEGDRDMVIAILRAESARKGTRGR